MAEERRRRELAASAALGALTADELARLEEEAKHDPELAEELDRYRATVAMLERGVARVPALDRLRARLLELVEAETEGDREERPSEAGDERSSSEPREGRVHRSHRPGRLLAAGLAAAVAAAVAVAITLYATQDGLGDPVARASISGTADFRGVEGEALLFDPDREDGLIVLALTGVPASPEGHHYEVWVLRSSASGAMEAVGAFSTAGGDVRLELRLPGPGDYEAVDISVQEDGGSAEHSGVTLAGGSFSS